MNNNYISYVSYKKQAAWSNVHMWLEMAVSAVAGGLFIISLGFEFSLGMLIAFASMILGKGTPLLLDLGRPERFIKVLARPKQSWISKGAWGFMFFAFIGMLSVAPLIIPSLPWTPWEGGGKTLGIAAGILAVFMMVYDGFFLADSKGVPFWSSGCLPIMFGSSAVVGGVGAFMVLAFMTGVSVNSGTLAVVNGASLGIAALSLYSNMKSAENGDGGAKYSVEYLTKGSLSKVFWNVTVGAGIAIPLALSAVALFGIPIPSLIWAIIGLLEIAGVVAMRYTVLKAGTYLPPI